MPSLVYKLHLIVTQKNKLGVKARKISLLFITLLSTLMALIIISWVEFWIWIEINLLRFLPLFIDEVRSKEVESLIKYALPQRVGSITLLLIIIISTSIKANILGRVVLILMILLKLGTMPFIFWLPRIYKISHWWVVFIISGPQKLIPSIILLNIIIRFNIGIITVIILTMTFSVLIGINQTNIKSIVCYSTLTHSSWIIISIHQVDKALFYLLSYILFLAPITYYGTITSVNKNNHFSIYTNWGWASSVSFSMMILNIWGLPPFLGFLPKVAVIITFAKKRFYILIIVLFCLVLAARFYIIISFLVIIRNYKRFNPKFESPIMCFWRNLIRLSLPLLLYVI